MTTTDLKYVALSLKARTVNGSKVQSGTMVRNDEGTLYVTISLVGDSKTTYAVFASRVGEDGFLTDLGRVGTARKERIGVYHTSTFRPDGTPAFDGYADTLTLAQAVERVVGSFLADVRHAEKVRMQKIVAADPTHLHVYNDFNVCDACGQRRVTKQEQIQTRRLEALPYVSDAKSDFVRTRGEKCAVLCKGRVGFFYSTEVGQVVADLAEVGLDVQVLAPTTVEIN